MTTAGTDQTTWKDVSYNISTGQYQSSSGLLSQITNLQKYIGSETNGSLSYDVVWCGLEMKENKQKFVSTIYSYKLQFITFINA